MSRQCCSAHVKIKAVGCIFRFFFRLLTYRFMQNWIDFFQKSSHNKMCTEARCGVCERSAGHHCMCGRGFLHTHAFRWTCLRLALWARGAMMSPWESPNFRGAIRAFNICLPFCPTCIKCLGKANWARRLNRIEKWRLWGAYVQFWRISR